MCAFLDYIVLLVMSCCIIFSLSLCFLWICYVYAFSFFILGEFASVNNTMGDILSSLLFQYLFI